MLPGLQSQQGLRADCGSLHSSSFPVFSMLSSYPLLLPSTCPRSISVSAIKHPDEKHLVEKELYYGWEGSAADMASHMWGEWTMPPDRRAGKVGPVSLHPRQSRNLRMVGIKPSPCQTM